MSQCDGNGDGERGVQRDAVDTIILTYNRANDHMDIGGRANSLDLMLDMLARATRAVELQKRKQDAIELQAALAQAAADRAVADAVRKGR